MVPPFFHRFIVLRKRGSFIRAYNFNWPLKVLFRELESSSKAITKPRYVFIAQAQILKIKKILPGT